MFSFAVRAVAGLLLSAVLAGCMPESKEPLAPPSAALPEPRLVGTWFARMEDDQVYLKIRQRDGNWFDIASFDTAKDGKDTLVYYRGYITQAGSRRIANLQEIGGGTNGYFFATYRLESANRLVVRFVGEKAVADAIKAGRLKGEVKESSLGNDVTIADEPARVADFLAGADAATLFDKSLTFTRTNREP
ncbi:MAG TPA: hypothetical protein VMQ73_16600 [Methylomirabilota bacterium]|nr:hypothetical protein [Methylomirabilota bacterium]